MNMQRVPVRLPFSEVPARILLTLWVGGMWAVGYVAAPVIFAVLSDRSLAGSVAGQLFSAMSYIGLACGGLLLVDVLYRAGPRAWRVWVLAVMLAIIVIGEFVLQPMMAELRAAGLAPESEAAARFGRLHGLASLLFLANSLLGLVLVIAGSPASAPVSRD